MAAERLGSLEQVRAFVEGSEGLDFAAADRSSRSDFVRRMLVKFDYATLGKATGLSRAQLTRLIGQRAKTGRIVDRQGRPGFVRVDSVRQGGLDGRKGVYELNLADEVTQYEFVGAVEAVSERFLLPVLEGLLGLFPFVIKGFHADNGSGYVNHKVAALLEKLRAEFTRSRPRRCNDNALVESKNASVVRRRLGREHLPARFAPRVRQFASAVRSPHLNFHRPCLFATALADANGKLRKVYRDVATPYERLKSLDAAERFLKPGVTFAALDAQAHAASDLESARRVHRERDRLLQTIRAAWPSAA